MGRHNQDHTPAAGRGMSRTSKQVLISLAALALVGAGIAGVAEASESDGTPAKQPAPVAAGAPQPATGQTPAPPRAAAAPVVDPYQKVLVVMEENETYGAILSSSKAPYLTSLAAQYGTATSVDAGYPVSCPSLPSYLLLTSGDRQNICDDKAPAAHPDPSNSIFAQVGASGRQWRSYAESMPSNCDLTDSGEYAVRHVPADYYTAIRSQCAKSVVPMGTTTVGAFHDDLTSGNLPAYSMLVPNLCDDMHGAAGCPAGDNVTAGDNWLKQVLPSVFASPDWKAGRLVVMVNWDEGDDSSNHIPALVLSPTTKHITVAEPLTDCSMLALSEDVLGLNHLGCAVGQPRRLSEFGLGR